MWGFMRSFSELWLPEEELLDKAKEQGIGLYGINASCMRLFQGQSQTFQNTVLLGYGALEKEELRQGIQGLQRAWKEYL